MLLLDVTGNGKLPPEDYVVNIEARFGKTRTGALAKLPRAGIMMQNHSYT